MGELGRWAQREGQKEAQSERRGRGRNEAFNAAGTAHLKSLRQWLQGSSNITYPHAILISPLRSAHHIILPNGNSTLPIAWVKILRDILVFSCSSTNLSASFMGATIKIHPEPPQFSAPLLAALWFQPLSSNPWVRQPPRNWPHLLQSVLSTTARGILFSVSQIMSSQPETF